MVIMLFEGHRVVLSTNSLHVAKFMSLLIRDGGGYYTVVSLSLSLCVCVCVCVCVFVIAVSATVIDAVLLMPCACWLVVNWCIVDPCISN